MKLSFRNRLFYASRGLVESLPREERDRWVPEASGFWTHSLRAAIQLQQYADESAKEELSRHIVRYYDCPARMVVPKGRSLDAHQIEGIRWALTRSRAYLAHAPGAGKTVQSIITAATAGGNALFIVPPLLIENWRREIARWAPEVCNESWSGHKEFPASDFGARPCWVLVPDSVLIKRDVQRELFSRSFTTVVVDEASRFKERSALRSRVLFHRRSPIYRARHSLLLDGSPMPNRPMELWWPTFSLAPESIDFMSEQEFGLRYCGARLNSYGRFEFRGASRVEELRQKLTLFFMHIVREEQLSHPERRRRIIFLPDSRPVEIRNWSRDNLSRVSFTDFIGEDDCSGELATLRRMIGLAKSPNAAKFIRERLAVGERILAFFWHREVGDELKRLLAHDEIICGNTPNAERVAQFDEFQAGYRQLILGNVQAMGRGVNLQNASRVIFVEFSWTDETNKQAEKRASRRGNNAEFVPCDYLAMPNSLDEIVLQVLFKKQSLVDRTIR